MGHSSHTGSSDIFPWAIPQCTSADRIFHGFGVKCWLCSASITTLICAAGPVLAMPAGFCTSCPNKQHICDSTGSLRRALGALGVLRSLQTPLQSTSRPAWEASPVHLASWSRFLRDFLGWKKMLLWTVGLKVGLQAWAWICSTPWKGVWNSLVLDGTNTCCRAGIPLLQGLA